MLELGFFFLISFFCTRYQVCTSQVCGFTVCLRNKSSSSVVPESALHGDRNEFSGSNIAIRGIKNSL